MMTRWRREGINLAQFSLLRNIKRHGPLSLTRLGEIVELDRSTLGRNVRVLERMGLVNALSAGADQRQAVVGLAADGVATLDRALPLWEEAQTDDLRQDWRAGRRSTRSAARRTLGDASDALRPTGSGPCKSAASTMAGSSPARHSS